MTALVIEPDEDAQRQLLALLSDAISAWYR